MSQKQEKEKYVVEIKSFNVNSSSIHVDKIVLRSSAFLQIPRDEIMRTKLQRLLRDQCSAKTLNFFSKRMEYQPYYEKKCIKGQDMYEVPLLFWYLEGITYDHLVDFRRKPTSMCSKMRIKSNFQLRDHQIEVHPLALHQLQSFPHFATTICAQCGSGKTIQASYLIGTLMVRTLVCVPILDLARQFKEELQLVMDISEDEIQLVGSEFPDPVPGKAIYICVFNSAMTTSHYRTKWASIFRKCDLLVVDECHKFPAKCVKSILRNFRGKYRLGLTATPQRKDGLSHMIFKLLGPQCVYVKREKPKFGLWKMTFLDYYNPNHRGDLYSKRKFQKHRERDAIAMMSRICQDDTRTKAIAEFMDRHLEKDVLVLGDRKNNLRTLVDELNKKKPQSTFLYTGGQSKSKKAVAEKEEAFRSTPYLVATTAKAGVGLNVPRINDVIFVTPRAPGVLLEQGSGRALRRKCPKHMYYVRDVATPYYMTKALECEKWFRKEGYQIMPRQAIGPLTTENLWKTTSSSHSPSSPPSPPPKFKRLRKT